MVLPTDGGGCACGYGPAFPWRLVVVGRASTGGKMTFHGAPSRSHRSPAMNLARCPRCRQFSFVDVAGVWGCRRCRYTGEADRVPTWPTGQVDFDRLEPPTGGKRRRPGRRSPQVRRRTPNRA